MRTPTDAPHTFFIDRSLGAHDVPDALRAAGAVVEIHDDHFAPDTPDIVWLAEVGARGWIVLTKDSRIRRHPLELHEFLSVVQTTWTFCIERNRHREALDVLLSVNSRVNRSDMSELHEMVTLTFDLMRSHYESRRRSTG